MAQVGSAVRGMVGVLLAGTIGLGSSGCVSGDETQAGAGAPTGTNSSSSASPTPSVDATQAAIDKRSAEAEKRYRKYWDIVAEYATKGESPFWELNDQGYLMGTFADDQREYWDYFASEGWSNVGSTRVVSVETTDYEGDPLATEATGQRVHLRICHDNTKSDVVGPDGKSVLVSNPERALANVVLQGQPNAGVWTITKYEAIEGLEC